jgi:tetratricopeptide (TPR) repeat protein
MTEGPVAKAQALHRLGRWEEAEALYREALRTSPQALSPIEGLGVLLFQRGRVGEAEALFRKAVELRPDFPGFHANLGEGLRLLGRLDEAFEHLNKAVTLDARSVQAWNSLALVALDRRRYSEAEAACREAINIQPRFAAAHINLGNALLARHCLGEAIDAMRTALSIEPDHVTGLTNLGHALARLGDFDLLDEAETLCRRAVALAPSLAQAVENLGHVLRQQGRDAEALKCYQRSAKLNPRRASLYQSIGQLLLERGRHDEAVSFFEKALSLESNEPQFHADLGNLAADRRRYDQANEHYGRALALDPSCVQAHQGLGLALIKLGRPGEADACFRAALEIDPTFAASWVGLARIQAQRGDFTRSAESARSALAIQPTLADAYCQLALTLKGDLPSADAAAIEALANQKYMTPAVASNLHFALGAVLDAQGSYARAAMCFDTANRLRSIAKAAKRPPYDPDRHTGLIDGMIRSFTAQFFADRRAWGDQDPRPVFIVGLPRSGTSLVEQILASHSKVHGAGELDEVQQLFHALPDLVGQPSSDAFAAVTALGPDDARAAARRYLDRLDSLAPPAAARVVDKMPDNIRFLGLISLLWPAARIIVCSRDLRDIAVSCRQTDFESIRWASDWEHMARRFADYRRIINHWRQITPLAWLEVRYEDVVGDIETQARRLIDHVGLEWEASCLQFYSTKRVVRTASMVQVRQPIYSHSVGRWRNYEMMLEPLLRSLERLGVEVDGDP